VLPIPKLSTRLWVSPHGVIMILRKCVNTYLVFKITVRLGKMERYEGKNLEGVQDWLNKGNQNAVTKYQKEMKVGNGI
jgi:hypothetical protein